MGKERDDSWLSRVRQPRDFNFKRVGSAHESTACVTRGTESDHALSARPGREEEQVYVGLGGMPHLLST